ncbi:hypothetical protein G7046_g3485 [Stylonectria norvegica]|nr:hypothetical protein G7046_g3485 [Stylonectria norvegica]
MRMTSIAWLGELKLDGNFDRMILRVRIGEEFKAKATRGPVYARHCKANKCYAKRSNIAKRPSDKPSKQTAAAGVEHADSVRVPSVQALERTPLRLSTYFPASQCVLAIDSEELIPFRFDRVLSGMSSADQASRLQKVVSHAAMNQPSTRQLHVALAVHHVRSWSGGSERAIGGDLGLQQSLNFSNLTTVDDQQGRHG